MRRVCIATGSRADWGLLSGIAKALNARSDVTLQIVATNMHLNPRYGNTYTEILDDGLQIDWRVPLDDGDDTPRGTVEAMSRCMAGMAEAFAALSPDLLVILGDRYEMLATASAALIMRIPIAHIAGGTVSEGAYDDSIRHAITKMSHIHLTETEQCRNRVIQMGENPDRVLNVGAIGVYNIVHSQFLSRAELETSLGVELPSKSLMVTLHPATLEIAPPQEVCRNLLDALDGHSDYRVIITYPNNDTAGRAIIELIEEYAHRHSDRVSLFRSLGQKRYLSVLRCVRAVVGNSSSGIVEVPSMHIPTLDIGIRQRGREASTSVLHCDSSKQQISAGLGAVLSEEWQERARVASNPYEQPDTLERIVDAICNTPLKDLTIKKFQNIEWEKH